jgi:antitoxin ParD1/3/4
MATIRKTITVTGKQDEWIKAQIDKGDFTNESEYIRALLRREQLQGSEFLETKAAIVDGLNSGVSDMDVPAIMKEVEARMRKDGRL